MLSATPLYGTFHSWMSNERFHTCAINEDRKLAVSDGEPQKSGLELTDASHITHSMVDASAACRMNPLAALGMERSGLMREGLHMHGGMVYPGIRALSADKAREGAALPLGYVSDRLPDLHYKPDVSLESRKPSNGYVGLYKSPPPGLQKPVLVPPSGGDTLGLDRRVGPADKPSELGLNGSSSYLHLPWVSPYGDAGMYPYLEPSKYPTLSMGSFISQPSPYLSQHLAYQSLCGAGGSAAGSERLFYMPPYSSAPISSPLAPPMRIPTATVAPAALSPLVHCQENSLQSLGPRIHHEPSAFGQQLHQQPPQTHHPSHSGKAARASGKSTAGSGHSVDSVPSPITITRPQTSIPPPPPLMESTMDFQKPLPPGPPASSSSSLSSSSSSPSTPHPYYITNMASEHSSPARSMGHKSKAKEGGAEHRPSGGERKPSRSPSKLAEKHLQQAPTKDPADKPLDLSAKMDFGATPNGFPPKLEPFAKLGHTPSSCYGLPPSRELLKETLPSSPSSSAGTPSKPSERPEIISTLHSSWVVPGPAPALVPIPAPALHPDSNQSKASSVIKNKNLERVTPQQRSSSCPRIGEPNAGPAPLPAPAVPTSTSRPASASPSPNINADWPRPEKGPTPVHTGSQLSSGKVVKVSKKAETQEVVYKPQPPHLENGHAPSRLYLSQSEAFLPPSLAYNRYLPYSVPDSLSLPHIPLPGKGPVYPHPVLLSSSTLYPPRLTPKPSLPYGIPSGHGDFLTYDSREMVHPLMSPHLTLDPKSGERPERRSIPQAKPPQGENMPHRGRHAAQTGDVAYRETGISVAHDAKRSNKPLAAGKEKMVCIDLVQADVDGGAQITKHIIPCTRKGDPSRPNGSEPELMQLLLSGQTGGVGFAAQKPAETERQPEICGGLRLVEPPRPSAACQRYGSPEPSPGEESPSGLSPLPDLAEQQTLRCARTSGDRTADEADSRLERHGLPHYTDLGAGGPESLGSHMDNIDIDGGNGSSRNRRSSLAKRIANSSGYVGDRFKCVTNELYTDSSKLSREQRALQRAMLRFSELELKERGSGGLAGRELAEGQAGEGIAEDSQQKDGVRLTCGSNRVPVLKRCTPQGETTPFQEWDGNVGATPSPLLVRDASRGLAPVGKRPHAEEEEEGGDEEVEQLASLAKRPRLIMDDWPLGAQCRPPEPVSADAGNLKVCIELRGLRLSRPPHLQCLLEFWERLEVGADTALAPREPAFPPASAFGRQEANPTDRKVRGCSLDERLAKKRSEVNRSWCDATLRDPDAEQASPRTYVQAGRLDSCSPDDSSSGTQDRRHRACDGEAEKPKGKRQCKTKHLSLQERRRASGGIEDCPQLELEPAPENEVAFRPSAAKQPTSPPYYDDPPAKVCPPSPCPAAPPTALQSLPSQPSPLPAGNPPPETPASRPMPPEARRLIVNKNAGETLLQRAARLGYEEVVLYCLENKVCDVNHRDNAGYCALHEACARGWLSIVQHLIEYGADINCSAQDGTRPLHDAVENDHLEVVRLLLSYGADPTLATYSGRSLLKMTHSDLMENFLLDYFADLQGHDDDDPGLRWDFYGSSVCEPAKDSAAFDILADPPGPGDDEEDLQQRGVFEFEFSDRPLLPCYNIQVSLSQGPRNWLLLSDVLKRLKMSARAFRTAFAHIEVATIAEAEFYKQASLSQLFSSPEELEGFLPNSKELLDLVEISGELATLLGSSVECLDSRWEPVGVATS